MFDDRYTLAYKLYPYERSADQDKDTPVRHPVVVMGGGPIGIATALDLGLQGIPVVVLDDHEGVGMGSRAICFAKRCLEIADRYGCGEPMLDKGVVWNVGKVFHKDDQVFEFNLLPEEGHKYPAFINLQQPYFESFQIERLRELQAQGAPIEIRGKNRIDNVTVKEDHVVLEISTPDGPYTMEADWLVGCDGASSPLREMLGYDFTGKVFQDSFLIADIKMKGDVDFPTERWFWFEPSHGEGASMLLHRQPDDVWRVDFQIGWDVDRKEEMKEENIRRRLDAFLKGVEYDMVWSSIYTFQCKRMDSFRQGRVFFAGDAAHQVSPFGARGANSGMQDVDNLGWKLGMVIEGKAPESLLDTYNTERVHGADENILNSTRSTDFITPKSAMSTLLRDSVLALSEHYEFARPMVNSGRLSVPCTYDGSALNSADALDGPARTRPGSPCPDVPLGDGYLLSKLGNEFILLTIDTDAPDEIEESGITVRRLALSTHDDPSLLLKERYLGDCPAGVYLIRPDQHVAARRPNFDENQIRAAIRRATGKE
ncbi:FAD-dependent oxidoreductase [Shimia thalassica]|uniref:FAD-dependent oxidoreductase n=1 Tax=Shimia thalassica TaxID=1715693 RepID=UPI000C06D56F|nr:FAD-dependent oxidoreductase [Shimia thalassica]PHO04580.1 FAD-dependent oxidoreductase [Rhodobacteraceae bacterium 4F10]MBU2943442.1 FAD-dependent oxidoreductase [Shimia thalassica]MDO6484522.1 FAD-dependent oxidoreductase [Shimia thalassica]MDO6501512.1 FAD-dependent oxidoreductase [Shimia thalassica]MDO6521845.1 FAD-dependent oxidoreductase [Shimia thalassica]